MDEKQIQLLKGVLALVNNDETKFIINDVFTKTGIMSGINSYDTNNSTQSFLPAHKESRLKALVANTIDRYTSSGNSTNDALDSTFKIINLQRKEKIRQARLAFNVCLFLIVLGVCIVFTGIIISMKLDPEFMSKSKIISIITGGITEIISYVVFKFYQDCNKFLNESSKETLIIEKTRVAFMYVDKITDVERRDKAIQQLIRNLSDNQLIIN